MYTSMVNTYPVHSSCFLYMDVGMNLVYSSHTIALESEDKNGTQTSQNDLSITVLD